MDGKILVVYHGSIYHGLPWFSYHGNIYHTQNTIVFQPYTTMVRFTMVQLPW